MKLYLMRHGEAVHPAMDARVPLSGRGHGDVLKIAKYLKNIPVFFDAVWHSPKARAEETAQIVADVLGMDKACFQIQPELVPEGSVDSVRQQIEAAAKNGRLAHLLIVSHFPFLPSLLASLTAGVSGGVSFTTAEVRCCVYENGLWRVQWSRKPGI